MDSRAVQRLRSDWDRFKRNELSTSVETEWRLFLAQRRAVPIQEMRLGQYTNLLDAGDEVYFTNLVERKTKHCGRFRASSSYGYGVYRARPKTESDPRRPEYRTADMHGHRESANINAEKAQTYFDQYVRPALLRLTGSEGHLESMSTHPLELNFARKVAYLYQPGRFLALFKSELIRNIASYFGVEAEEEELDSYLGTQRIKQVLDAAWSISPSDASWNAKTKEVWSLTEEEWELTRQFEMSQKLSAFLFLRFGQIFEFEHKNIIFFGAPGTGKTYRVQEAISQLALLSGRDLEDMQEFVQFHPSYSYEDFIEGLKPVNLPGGGVGIALQSGMFKKFCRRAMDELRLARSERRTPVNFYFVADEINRAELSRVLGEVLVCLEESKRVDFKPDGTVTGLRLKSQYSHLDNADDAVLTINGAAYFGIPSNLYFIGTMNDIDRSIDSFDMALRRRFVWRRMDCDYEVIKEHFNVDTRNLDSYEQICKKLNEFIAKDLGLGKSYEIGHAYFTALKPQKTISDRAVGDLFDSKIAPLLSEYLRSEYGANELAGKLQQARQLFSLPTKAQAAATEAENP